jgi:hypothetical protein
VAPNSGSSPRTGIARLLPSDNLEGSLYGVVLATSLLATLDDHEAPGYAIAALLITAIVFALAHAWSRAMGWSAAQRAALHGAALLRSVWRESALVLGALPAMLALVPVALGWYSTETGLWLGLAVNVALLFVWGAGVRRLAGGSRPQAAWSGLASSSLGLLLALLKVFVH